MRKGACVKETTQLKMWWLKVLLVVIACAVLSVTLAGLLWYTHHLGLNTLFDVVAVFAFIAALLALGVACYVIFFNRERVAAATRSREKEVV